MNVTIYTCSICRTSGPWSPSWSWWGSYLDIDARGADSVPKFCSDACAGKFRPPDNSGPLVRRKRGRS